MTDTSVQAGIYCRMSLASDDDTTKVDDQERICRELAARLGWSVADVYSDNNKSAWQRNRKRREWERMLADVDSGRITAIVVYHGDRLYRRGTDLAKLLDLAEGKGVRLASPSGTRDLDTERFELWIRAAVAEEESQRTSERRKAQYQRWYREGRTRPGGRGGRAFGFETDGMTQVPAECDAIRDATRRILAGASQMSIVTDWNARGILTTAGGPWHLNVLKKMLARPRYAGLMPDGTSPGAWQPVLERAEWEALRATLAVRRGTQQNVTSRGRYLLSGIAKCGADGCGSLLYARQSGPRGRGYSHEYYGCRAPGCRRVGRSVASVDAYVTGGVLQRIADSGDSAPQLRLTAGIAAEMQALQERRREAERIIEDLAGHPGQRLDILARSLESFDRRLAELRERAGDDRHARVLHAHRHVTTREQFRALELATQRSLVQAAFAEIVILPSVHRGPRFRPELVRLLRHDQGNGGADES